MIVGVRRLKEKEKELFTYIKGKGG